MASCIYKRDLHIIGLAETHLIGENNINIDGYKWYGNNRKLLHVRARNGSGGVGILVKDEIHSQFDIRKVDESIDGILWLCFSERKNEDNCFFVCVVYLPPEHSARSVNIHDFFDTLMTQIHTVPCGKQFFLCGDWNSRVADIDDYIQGIDYLPERNVVDFTPNSYGEIFCEFLSNINCCILNGRNCIKNDFTFVSTRGSSVVDYCVVPYENLSCFTNFEVLRARTLFDEIATVGSFDPQHIPDHSMFTWTFKTFIGRDYQTVPDNTLDNGTINTVRFDTRNVPIDWMSDAETVSKLNILIQDLETSELNQSSLDSKYGELVKIVHDEMELKLNKLRTNVENGTNNKRRRMKKPWWNDDLTVLWNDVCKAEREWQKCTTRCKKDLRHVFAEKRKNFDRYSQRAKRQYWYSSQEQLLDVQHGDPREFWKRIGKIGVGSERQKSIPMEVMADDGTVIKDTDTVLNKWKNCFSNLLNSNQSHIDINVNSVISDDFLDNEILYEEVVNAIAKSKSGKSPGIDCIPVELFKNTSLISALHTLFNMCFKYGKIPSEWGKSIIIPIPKSSTADPRDPLSYRGISLAPCAYKLYCHILNERLVFWLEENDIIHDEQNGFRKNRSTLDHLHSITSIIENRKLRKLSTFTAFIDFKKAYDTVSRKLLFTKLSDLGLSTKFLCTLNSIYSHVECCIRLNGKMTEWFDVNTGLKQGCVLSPIMFNIFINNLIDAIKSLDIGVNIDDEKIGILLYADDIVLMAENENDLQVLLNVLSKWCATNCLNVNLDKSKIVHFRNPSVKLTSNIFTFNDNVVQIVSSYQYLGLLLTEFLDYNEMAKVVARSASRALSLLIVKS